MEELDLKQLFNIFWNKKLQILIVMVVFILIGGIYSYTMVTPQYKSSTTLVLARTENGNANATTGSITQSELTVNQKLVSTYSELIKSKSVLREVISNLNMEGLAEANLRKSVSVSSVKDTELIEITVNNANPNYAEKIANEIATVFTKQVGEIYNVNNVHVVDKGEIATAPYNVNHIKDMAIFGFVGLVVACAYVLIANMLDTTIKTSEDVERSTGLLVLAQIPEYDFNIKVGGNK